MPEPSFTRGSPARDPIKAMPLVVTALRDRRVAGFFRHGEHWHAMHVNQTLSGLERDPTRQEEP